MTGQTLEDYCKKLRLSHIITNLPRASFEAPEQFITDLFRLELETRQQIKLERMEKLAKFPVPKSLKNYEWHEDIFLPAHLDKATLVSLDFLKRQENIVCVGSPGTGETHLAIALGRKACSEGVSTKFFRVNNLVEQLESALKKQQLASFKKRFETTELIILDEMGYLPLTKEGAELLFQLISDWYEQKSIIITSNLEFSQWNRVFMDSRLTAALVDRLIHHAHIISFKGESFRLKNSLSKSY
ncbi:IS21-like element helper ATPase IstB [Enterococcus faecium]|uniref:IstB-like ATP binding protein n=1 Tax=Enterococcus faecium TaxID=1352 RepID=A0A242BG84_ENTFC|nr:IS21-like element helper ATPase IstB [Enterococcus faecium]OTN94497.1 IstB-like ATP binding protein [Enterococcus faecium]